MFIINCCNNVCFFALTLVFSENVASPSCLIITIVNDQVLDNYLNFLLSVQLIAVVQYIQTCNVKDVPKNCFQMFYYYSCLPS